MNLTREQIEGWKMNNGAMSVNEFRALCDLALRSFASSSTAPTQLSPFQGRVAPFMEHCFGQEISADTIERYHRFIEESLELAQSLGCLAEDAHMLVDYVFNRPIGEPHQEAGGVMVTLAALCLAARLDMHQAGEDELRRVWGKIAVIREKQKNKPRGPLPQRVESAPSAIERKLCTRADCQETRPDRVPCEWLECPMRSTSTGNAVK